MIWFSFKIVQIATQIEKCFQYIYQLKLNYFTNRTVIFKSFNPIFWFESNYAHIYYLAFI